jgi:FkbH-like protein
MNVNLTILSKDNLTNLKRELESSLEVNFNVRDLSLTHVYDVAGTLSGDRDNEFLLHWDSLINTCPEFSNLLNYSPFDKEVFYKQINDYAQHIQKIAANFKFVLIPTWEMNLSARFGTRELAYNDGIYIQLLQSNLMLSKAMSGANNVRLLNSSRWFQLTGPKAWSSKLWYMAKIPYGEPLIKLAANEIIELVKTRSTGHIKLIVVDLDDTLWGGVIGDEGIEGIRLGGHDPVGESFVDFQKYLKILKDNGILLAIASKNTREIVEAAFNKHPEMVLKLSDFVDMRIDWNDKADNIKSIIKKLNIGEQSVMFIDDNPIERDRVRYVLPEVSVPEWPIDKLKYVEYAKSLTNIDISIITNEDKIKTILYEQESNRHSSISNFEDRSSWLASLKMKVQIKSISRIDITRTLQLLNKTNQFNLTTSRYGLGEFEKIIESSDRLYFVVRVEDIYGSAGLTGIIGLDLTDTEFALVSDMVLSCRVMGRGVEDFLISSACSIARKEGRRKTIFRYLKTDKNQPCFEYLTSSDLISQVFENGIIEYSWININDYACPEHITVSQE